MKHSATLTLIILLIGVKIELKAQVSPPVYLDYSIANFDDLSYLWNVNTLYTLPDSGINYTAVTFNNGDGYTDLADPLGSVINQPFPSSFLIDSVFLDITHENNSGNYDYFIIQIVNVVNGNQPGSTVLWQAEDSSNVSMSPNGNWVGTGALFQLGYQVQIAMNEPFAVVFKYVDASLIDTCGIVGSSIDNGSGFTNLQSTYPNSWMQYLPLNSTTVLNVNTPGIPLGSSTIFTGQNWKIFAKIDPIAFSNGSIFYTYLTTVQPNCISNGSITAVNYGGVPPFNYLWSNSETTQTVTGLTPGFYAVSVTDDSGYVATGNCNLLTACSNVVQGVIFNDINGNCIQDAGELPFQYASVTAGNGSQSYYGIADYYGNYSINIPLAGTFNINAYTPSFGYDSCGSVSTPEFRTV